MLKIFKLSFLYSIEPHLRALKAIGIEPSKVIFNPSVPTIYFDTFHLTLPVDIFTKKSFVSTNGALCAYSGQYTQRMPRNSRVAKDNLSQELIEWNEHNVPIDSFAYEMAENLAIDYINHKPYLYVVDGYLGWHPTYRLKVRSYCTRTYHALFLRNMLIRPTKEELERDFSTSIDINLFDAGQLHISKRITKTEDDMLIGISPSKQNITILGTQFAGQMKKALFKMANFILPRKGVLPLRASAFTTENENICVLVGLPGSGKGTLAMHANKKNLLANDEIIWSNDGISNLQGGVYARILNLRNKMEDQVEKSISFGAVVENANPMEHNRDINFRDASVSQNARLCYPLNHLKIFKVPPNSGHPKNIILLTCDLEGVLPPVAKLSYEQALFYYLNGYTAKINNKEINPRSVFETCYAGDSSILHSSVYADLFYERLSRSKAQVWLLNTGWMGGRHGIGKRMEGSDSERIIDAINKGQLDNVENYQFKYLNLQVPQKIQGVQEKLLHPDHDWANKKDYDETLKGLCRKMAENYKSKFQGKIRMDISKVVPSV